MRGWGKSASRDSTEVTCRFRLYGCRGRSGRARVGRGAERFSPCPLHPSTAPGQCERVRGLEMHVMCVSWVPWG